MPISRTNSRRGLFLLAMMNVSVGPRTTSTHTMTSTTRVTSVRCQPGQRYQPKYRDPSINVSTVALESRCNENAWSRNRMVHSRQSIDNSSVLVREWKTSRESAAPGKVETNDEGDAIDDRAAESDFSSLAIIAGTSAAGTGRLNRYPCA